MYNNDTYQLYINTAVLFKWWIIKNNKLYLIIDKHGKVKLPTNVLLCTPFDLLSLYGYKLWHSNISPGELIELFPNLLDSI